MSNDEAQVVPNNGITTNTGSSTQQLSSSKLDEYGHRYTTTNPTPTNNNQSTRYSGTIPTTTTSQLSTIHEQTTFRNMSMNSIAVVPLLSSSSSNSSTSAMSNTHSTQSFHEFMTTLQHHPYSCSSSTSSNDSVTTSTTSNTVSSSSSSSNNNNNNNNISLIVPNSSCTRPSDWKYETTPFTSFHWNVGCQRYIFYDGRPSSSVSINNNNNDNDGTTTATGQDQEMNYYHYTASTSYRNYIDLYPHRRTAAIIGILNIQDCILQQQQHAVVADANADDDTTTTKNMNNNTVTIGQMIHRACEELQQWAYRYSLPSYGATMYGHTTTDDNNQSDTVQRDVPVTRLYVYDTFNMETPIDINTVLSNSSSSHTTSHIDTSSIIAFPPTTQDHSSTMILHYNLIVSDLMVTIFRQLEHKASTAIKRVSMITSSTIVQASNTLEDGGTTSGSGTTGATTTSTGMARRSLARFVTSTSSVTSEPATTTTTTTIPSATSLGINQLVSLVDPENDLVKNSPTKHTAITSGSSDDPTTSSTGTTTTTTTNSSTSATVTSSSSTKQQSSTTTISTTNTSTLTISKLIQLLTPMDDEFMTLIYESSTVTTLTTKDMELLKKREMGRQYKYIGDICLLAGTPLDAYEYYLKAMELCKGTILNSSASTNHSSSSSFDPLWYAATLEACAVVHIVMAEIGGYGVDEYLENNFQLPEEIMALVRDESKKLISSSGNSKQTLPEVVFALCDEALNILNRHHKLGGLYAELVLKLATYTSEEAEAHLRCRWGDGPYCYSGAGDHTNSNSNDQVKRWDIPSVSKLKFHPLRTKDGYSMITINTHNRIKKLCALLSVAASIGSLDPSTRLDVAVRCARICLYGVKPTHWKGPVPERIKLPRKAAFFVAVAAEAMTERQQDIGKNPAAQSLWLLATRLYSCTTSNPMDGGGGYGWATLRAFCLDALSNQGSTVLSLEAVDQLLSLLGRLDPVTTLIDDISSSKAAPEIEEKNDQVGELALNEDSDKISKDAPRASVSLEDPDVKDALSTANQFAKNIRATYNTLTAGSSLVVHQAKWATEKPVPSIDVPLSKESFMSPYVVSLKGVWPHMRHDIVTKAQNLCLDRATSLRRAIPKSSANVDTSQLYYFEEKDLPLYLSCEALLPSDPALDLECIKKRVTADTSKSGGLETFYNPFAKKNSTDDTLARIAENEERTITLTFGNHLSLPVHIQQSQLEFNDNARINATSLSFVIPPRANSFAVSYPFRVIQRPDPNKNQEEDSCSIFEVKGVTLVCHGRQLSLSIKTRNKMASSTTESFRLHVPRGKEDFISDELNTNPRIECYPCQPKLEIFYSDTNEHLPDVIPISLVAGETFTLPTLRLRNVNGDAGKIECLEIVLVGTPNRKLFDSSVQSMGEAVTIDEFVSDMIFGNDTSPFKIRALADDLDIEGINGNGGKSNTFTFQVATGFQFQSRFPLSCKLDVLLRYRGIGSSKVDVWRKCNVSILIKTIKGPRISSIEFRPDLMMNDLSFASEVNEKWATIVKSCDLEGKAIAGSTLPKKLVEPMLANAITPHSYVSVCGPTTVFIMTITNDSQREITVRQIGASDDKLYELEHLSYINEIVIGPGVSAALPVLSPRIPRVDENGIAMDVVSMFIQKTTILWNYTGEESTSRQCQQQGYIRIPPTCFNDILHKLPATISQFCAPPISIDLMLNNSAVVPLNRQEKVGPFALGQPISFSMQVKYNTWFQQLLQERFTVSNKDRDVSNVDLIVRMGFQCRREEIGTEKMHDQHPSDYFWIGLLERSTSTTPTTVSTTSSVLQHSTKLIVCTSGTYAITANVRIIHNNNNNDNTTENKRNSAEEIWWSPISQIIHVQ